MSVASPKPLIAGNWKMFGRRADLAEIGKTLAAVGPAAGRIDIVFCPPATLTADAAAAAGCAVGGQDCHAAAEGAHTGDIAAAMLADLGARCVIVGHSERRRDHGETSAAVAAKARAAMTAGLFPIICVGETLEERRAGAAGRSVAAQLAESVPDGADARTVIAYEPVWAIGTGLTPSAAEIAEMHGHMRALLAARFGPAGRAMRLLYGGSVKPSNAAEIFAVPDVNGALVGGASLKATDFAAIIRAHPAAGI